LNHVKFEPHVIIEQRDFWVLLIELSQSQPRKFGEVATPFGIALGSENCLAVLHNPHLNSHAHVLAAFR
jgi:hypothetical protein